MIIIINSGNIIDLSWLNNYKDKISALLLAWQGGMESGRALANILVGNANPSGKLPDTIAQKYDYYPSSNSFGQPEITEYVEDIYVGYRYFETFHPEQVLYPFGYGLSYSQFTVNSNASIQDDSILIKVQVENVGEVAGKEVVQVYYNPPQGKLGKSLRNLIRFDKTVELKPKESEELEFKINISEMASYDDSGATGNPYCYVLEPGQYDILVGTSLLDLKLVCTYDLKKIRVTEKLSQKAPAEYEFNRMFPKRVGNDLEVAFQKVPVRIENLKEKIIQSLPPKITIPNKDNLYLSTSKTIEELILSLTPTELDSLTRGEGKMDSPLGPKGNAGILGGTTDSLREKGIPPITTTDGPAGIRLNYYTALLPCGTALASSWNTALVEELGKVFGAEMKALKTQVILAPGMNIHRNPLGGRNFEYFSEDPYLSGKMGAHYVLGVQSNKVAACPKHFVCNNQETNRNKNDSRVSERALREIYLKGFEICIKEAKPYSIMTSYNKINGVWAHYHYDLVTDILRNEWKYDGCVMTDWWMQLAQDPNFEHLTNNAYRLRAQVDILMPGGLSFTVKENDNSLIESLEKENGITIEEVRRSAANILRFIEKIYA
ncbi:beta-glucosidase [Globicatella sp. PHS-GS-PNBC-21-1553]|uniref:beta-glucosidase n=1 Tax=Globicatella sp. PHS-GS-PNBC-21-1553 TaxID=2885764 RepID=UPI00298EDD5B|nr:glycoside hydrolase family 3 N-terminal domain-containing protein [Globicatella sp. PHS-GS-PNBC-21-1553]